MAAAAEKNLLGLDLQELTAIVENFGQPRYRARQLFEAIYRRRATDLAQLTDLPSEFRMQLAAQGYAIAYPVIERSFVSSDGTIRYLLRFADGQSVETVWMPE